jgi:hypothetical protein
MLRLKVLGTRFVNVPLMAMCQLSDGLTANVVQTRTP